MISAVERSRMLAVTLCGSRVIQRLEATGVRRLTDLRGRDPYEVLTEVNLAAGRPIWRPPMAIWALENLIAAAADEAPSVRVRVRGNSPCNSTADWP
jgi:hypothetical protein